MSRNFRDELNGPTGYSLYSTILDGPTAGQGVRAMAIPSGQPIPEPYGPDPEVAGPLQRRDDVPSQQVDAASSQPGSYLQSLAQRYNFDLSRVDFNRPADPQQLLRRWGMASLNLEEVNRCMGPMVQALRNSNDPQAQQLLNDAHTMYRAFRTAYEAATRDADQRGLQGAERQSYMQERLSHRLNTHPVFAQAVQSAIHNPIVIGSQAIYASMRQAPEPRRDGADVRYGMPDPTLRS